MDSHILPNIPAAPRRHQPGGSTARPRKGIRPAAHKSPRQARAPKVRLPAPEMPERRTRSTKTKDELQAELDGYTPSPVLSYKPAVQLNGHVAGEVHRWETSRRYFEARIELDMFQTPILMVANGGIGTKLGMLRVVAAGEQIDKALQDIERRREAHGYRKVQVAS